MNIELEKVQLEQEEELRELTELMRIRELERIGERLNLQQRRYHKDNFLLYSLQ